MSSTNGVIISAAGGGKTTRIVRDALECSDKRSIMLTYTDNNIGELKKRFYELNSSVPDHVEVSSWYTFLLREMAQSRLRKFEQVDRSFFCLTTAIIAVNRRDHEQTTAPEPHTGPQGEGGACRRQGQPDDRHNWPSILMSTPIRLRPGRRSWRGELPEFSDRGTWRRPHLRST